MKPRILCTTALEETWPGAEPVLFLGEWCRRHSRREAWSKLDHELLPYHWDDREKLFADYQYLAALHERLLGGLTSALNDIHGVNHSQRYWRIVAGPWLGTFVHILFDRWTMIRRALARGDVGASHVIGDASYDLVPNDMQEFVRFHVSDDWNHHVCALLLRDVAGLELRELPVRTEPPAPIRRTRLPTRVKLALAGAMSRALGLLTRDQDAFLLATYLPASDEIRLNRRFNGVPQFRGGAAAPRAAAERARRTWRLPGESADDFEECARRLIARQIPAVFLEGYRHAVQAAAALPWPRRPRFIWTSNAHRGDDLFCLWAAEKAEQGAPLVIGQHGGHYGTGLFCFGEDHDLAISDRYLSWGWSDASGKVAPTGAFIRIPAPRRARPRDELLLVTGVLPRYSYWLYSATLAGQWLSYFEDQCRLVAALPEPLRAALRVRLYPADFGWDHRQRWRDRFAQLRLDDGVLRLEELIDRCRVYVATYNATTFLETIAADVPTVIHWNPQHWELRPSAAQVFARLEAVGIFHRTPESAARHLAAVWDDVDRWWRSPAVRDSLAVFSSNYCARPPGLLARIESQLADVSRR